MQVLTIEKMRAVEAAAEREYGLTGSTLMANAGANAARIAIDWLGGDGMAEMTCVFLIGPGNNGGDGRVMAQHLAAAGTTIALYDWRAARLEDRAGQPLPEPLHVWLEQADVVIDAWLGIGHTRPLSAGMIAINDQVRAAIARRKDTLRVIAVDLPSGVDADTGAVDPGTLAADLTITLGAPKIGLFFFPAFGLLGQLKVSGIGLPDALNQPATADWLTPEAIERLVPPRPLESHKGSFGKTLIVAGSRRYPGAALLASRAAARAGTGLVTLAVTADLIPYYAVAQPEMVYVAIAGDPHEQAQMLIGAAQEHQALLIGPGLDRQPATRTWFLALLAGLRAVDAAQRPHLVLDADALNILSEEADWWRLVPSGSVLTPHPGEMSRLIGGAAQISGGGPDRLPALRDAVARWEQVVVLKGAVTLIGSPDPRQPPRINAAPNPAMATAGMGDVLAGTIASLLAQGMVPFDAATLGVAMHSEAGAQAARDLGFVRAGVLASDVVDRLPAARAYYEQWSSR